jgi:hypothetical protein
MSCTGCHALRVDLEAQERSHREEIASLRAQRDNAAYAERRRIAAHFDKYPKATFTGDGVAAVIRLPAE